MEVGGGGMSREHGALHVWELDRLEPTLLCHLGHPCGGDVSWLPIRQYPHGCCYHVLQLHHMVAFTQAETCVDGCTIKTLDLCWRSIFFIDVAACLDV